MGNLLLHSRLTFEQQTVAIIFFIKGCKTRFSNLLKDLIDFYFRKVIDLMM